MPHAEREMTGIQMPIVFEKSCQDLDQTPLSPSNKQEPSASVQHETSMGTVDRESCEGVMMYLVKMIMRKHLRVCCSDFGL